MRRREFITLLGGAAAWPLTARAQQPVMPVIGMLRTGTPATFTNQMAAFHKGLSDAGYVEGLNVSIEYRWAGSQNDLLPVFAAELVRRKVAIIVTVALGPALAAKAATDLSLKHRLPTIFTQREYVEAGGLMSYGESARDFNRRAAAYVGKILKGSKPAELPIEQPNRFSW